MSLRQYLPNVRKWLSKRYRIKKVPTEIEVIVRSAGGGGSTTLIQYLSLYKKMNDAHDCDGIKHSRNLDLAEGQKQIIILSNPRDIYKSLDRRSYLNCNCLKLGFLSYFVSLRSLFYFECRQIQLKWNSEWDSQKSTLIIHYKDLFESADKIQKHLHISDGNFVLKFPKRKKRSSE